MDYLIAFIVGLVIGFIIHLIINHGQIFGSLNITEDNEMYLSLKSEDDLQKMQKHNIAKFTIKKIKSRNNQSL